MTQTSPQQESASQMTNLRDLYIDEIKDAYSAEQQVLDALGKMESAAQSEELKDVFREHREQTQEQSNRLKSICDHLKITPSGKTCEGIAGILKEGEKMMAIPQAELRDAALIASAQRVEHYEMATYGTLRNHAKLLDYDDDADLLQETLDQEGKADKKLTKLATGGFMSSGINEEATE